MEYKTYLTTLLYSFLLGLILPASAQNSLQHQKDSLRHALEHAEGIDKLRTYNRLYNIYMAEAGDDLKMDTLMTLFEQTEAEAARQGNVKLQGMVGVWQHHHLLCEQERTRQNHREGARLSRFLYPARLVEILLSDTHAAYHRLQSEREL